MTKEELHVSVISTLRGLELFFFFVRFKLDFCVYILLVIWMLSGLNCFYFFFPLYV